MCEWYKVTYLADPISSLFSLYILIRSQALKLVMSTTYFNGIAKKALFKLGQIFKTVYTSASGQTYVHIW